MRKNKGSPDDPLPLLSRLNDDIEFFMQEAVETSFDSSQWGSISELFEPIRCWEIKNCKKRKCPSYRKVQNRCWLTVGTFCGGKVQGEFAQKYKTCCECNVFTGMAGGPGRRLYENINTLISFIRDESRKLRQLAVRDPLTRLYNRHFFNEVIEREALRSERNREPLSLIMMDLDHFKKINDTLGHLSGDELLKDFAALIQGTIRRSDLAFRFGGDEFLVLMLNADCNQSNRMAKRLLAATEQWNRDNEAAHSCTISFSMGCVTRKKGDNIHTVLRKADSLMYLNKKARKEQRAPRFCSSGETASKDCDSSPAEAPSRAGANDRASSADEPQPHTTMAARSR